MEQTSSSLTSMIEQQYRMIHALYVLLDDGDRRTLQPLGLTIPQYRVLLLLNKRDGLRLTTLSEHLIRAKSTITRIVDQLEQQGLVVRTSDLEDRRAQRVLLTDKGANLLVEARIAQENMLVQRMNIALSSAEQTDILALLQKLHDSLVETRELVGPISADE